MHVAVIGPGRIGGNIAERLARAGHTVAVAFSFDPEALAARAGEVYREPEARAFVEAVRARLPSPPVPEYRA